MQDPSLRDTELGRLVDLLEQQAQHAGLEIEPAQLLREKLNRHRHAEEQLLRRERDFTALVEHAPDVIARFDRQFRHVYINPSIERATGISREQFIGKTSRELGMPGSLCDLWEQKLAEAFAGQQDVFFEFEFRSPIGIRQYEARLVPELLADGSVESVMGVARDITEYKRAEGLQADQTHILEMIALGYALPEVLNAIIAMIERHSPGSLCAIYVLDGAGKRLCCGAAGSLPPDFQVAIGGLEVGPMGGSENGVTHLGQPVVIEDLSTADKCQLLRETALAYGLRACWSMPINSLGGAVLGTLAVYNRRSCRPDQQQWQLLETASHMAGIAIERTRTDKALRERELRFRALIDKSWDGISIISGEGVLQCVSPAITRRLGYELDEITGRSIFEYIHPEDAPRVRAEMDRLVEGTGDDSVTVVLRFRHRNGSWRWLEASGTNHLTDPAIGGIVVNYHDITERKLAEEALQQERWFLRKVVDAAPVLIFVKDWNGHFLLGNEALARCYGTSVEGLVGKTDADFNRNGDEVAQFRRDDREVMSGRREKLIPEEKVTYANGEEHWLTTIKVPLLNEDGTCNKVLAIATDITDRKRVEEVLRQREQHLRLVLDTLPVGVWFTDEKGGIIQGNAAGQRIWGGARYVGPGQYDQYKGWWADTGKRIDSHEWAVARALKGETSLNEVIEIERFDGTRRVIQNSAVPIRDENGRITGALIVNEDVTERRRAEEALRQSEEKFRAMAETIPAILFTSQPDGVIDYSNQWFIEFTGLPREMGQGWQWTASLHPEDAQWVQDRWRYSLSSGEPFQGEYRLRAADGSYHWFVGRARPIKDAAGHIIKWFGIVTDISELKRAEAELKQAKEAAEAANHAKDQFFAVLSHELRTPLTPVLTAAQMLEMNGSLPPDLRESAVMIHRNVELEARLIDDLLDLTRIARGKLEMHFEVVDLHQKLWHVIEICDNDIRSKQMSMTVTLRAARHHVYADAARLQQILWNLLRNAVKFTPSGGRITIRTENRDQRIAVSVQDTGIGIEPDMLPRLFSAFEQGGREVTRQFGGLGLGLAISKGLVDLHGGNLTAHSEGKGKGATFTLELPMSVGEPAAAKEVCLPEACRAKRGRILLVEDHFDTAKMLAALLKSYGFEVRIASSVGAALQSAEAEAFDLLISDIGLPDGDGLELMRQLRAMHPVKGIALSGYGMEEDVRKSKEAGFLAHLTKPVSLQQLEEALRMVCG